MSTTNLNLDIIEATDSISNAFLTKMNGNMNKLDSAYGILKAHLLQKTGKTNLNDAINYIDSLVNAQDATATADKLFNGYTAYKGTQKITGTALATETPGDSSLILRGWKFYKHTGELVTGTMASYNGVSSAATSGSVEGDNYKLRVPANGYYTIQSYLTRPKATVLSELGANVIPTINVTLTGDSTYMGYITGYGAGINKDGVLVIWAMSRISGYEHICFVDTSIGVGTRGKGWNITSFDTSDPTEVPHACTITGLSGKNTINVTLDATGVNASYDFVVLNVTLTAS